MVGDALHERAANGDMSITFDDEMKEWLDKISGCLESLQVLLQ
jgi:hypothetical protein